MIVKCAKIHSMLSECIDRTNFKFRPGYFITLTVDTFKGTSEQLSVVSPSLATINCEKDLIVHISKRLRVNKRRHKLIKCINLIGQYRKDGYYG